jgi:ribonuclease BN (tRNA processing enzyme)
MHSRVVVLGGCGAWPEPGRACSGFLLEHDGFRVALDLGYGTLPPLLSLLGSTTAVGLDAIIVTHDHPDHVVDLHGLFRARLYDGRQEPRIALYAPEAVLERIAGLEDSDRSTAEMVFTWRPLPAGAHALLAGQRPRPLAGGGRRGVLGRSADRRRGRGRPAALIALKPVHGHVQPIG